MDRFRAWPVPSHEMHPLAPRLALLPVLAALGFALLPACGGEEFPVGLPDDAYALETMLLDPRDLPLAMDKEMTETFDNAEWARLFDVEDLRAKLNQLDARGRINGAVRVFSREDPFQHRGLPARIIVQSTLYADVAAAAASLSLFCGTFIDERTAIDVTEFWVDTFGDGVQGLIIGEQMEGFGRTLETLVCFRTGRVVHAVLQSGLDGTADIALNVRTARRMLERVRALFDGL